MVTNQKKFKTKLVALLMLILITVCSVFTITASADNEVNFAIDVVFVIEPIEVAAERLVDDFY
jgi:hypothetical protein